MSLQHDWVRRLFKNWNGYWKVTLVYSCNRQGFVKQTWSIYTFRLYPDKSKIKWVDTSPKDKWESNGVLLVSCLPPPPSPPPNPCFKVQWSSKLQFTFFATLLRPISSFHLFSRPRWDTSAKWVSLRRMRWPPADTWHWPPLPAPDQLHQSFSYTATITEKKQLWLMIHLSS